MDLCAVNVRTTHLLRNWVPERSVSGNVIRVFDIRGLRRNGFGGSHSLVVRGKKNHDSSSNHSGNIRVFKIGGSRRNGRGGSHTLVVRGKKNHDSSDHSSSGSGDPSFPEGDGTKGKNTPSEKHKSSLKVEEWREFRATLFAGEQTESIVTHDQGGSHLQTKPLGPKWAHPLSSPETGCVLVATENLDGVPEFERTVVLLLRSGTHHPQEGPFGVVINRPLHRKIKHMNPTNINLATTFSECPLCYGGPLEASMFLLKTGGKSHLPGFEEVVPGLSFGARNSLDEAAILMKKGVLKAQDFKFFVGYAGWQLDQLRGEIESDYWHIAACSANLLFGASTNSSSEGLWEEVLQLMGGHYLELSRKPKKDS